MKLNNEMVEPLKELVGNLLEQLEITEKEIAELHDSNEHYIKRFDEVSNELETSKRIIKEKEKELVNDKMKEDKMKEIVNDKMKRDYNMLNELEKR